MSLTYVTASSNLVDYLFELEKLLQCELMGKMLQMTKLKKYTQKTMSPEGCLPLPKDYTHV